MHPPVTVRVRPLAAARALAVWLVAHADAVAVGALATFVVAFYAVHGLFVDRPVGAEEVVLLNPAYEFAQTGATSFPAYAFSYGERLYGTLGIHPHVHYQIVGAGLRAGLEIRAAEAVPIIATAALAVMLVLVSQLSTATRLGVLFGLAAGVAVSVEFMSDETFSARPEFHLTITWVAGLLALETGRRRGWAPAVLLAGAALVTLASTMQWFSLLGFVGAGVYVLAAVRELGRGAVRAVAAVCSGVAIVGIPYVVFFLLPNRDLVETVRNLGWSGDRPGLDHWLNAFPVYDAFRDWVAGEPARDMLATAGPLELALATQIPLFALAVLLLLSVPELRLFGLAALPLPLWSFLAANHRAYYLIPEVVLYSIAIAVVAAHLIRAACRRLLTARQAGTALLGASAVACAALASSSPSLADADLRITPLPHPMDVARMAGRTIVGPDALVATEHQLWYIAGARYWHDFTPWAMEDATIDPRKYFAPFDAVARTPYWTFSADSLRAAPRTTVAAALYADGSLSLRGFFVDAYSYVVWRPTPLRSVLGYVRRGKVLYRFRSSPRGESVLVSTMCPLEAPRPTDPRSPTRFRFSLADAVAPADAALAAEPPLPADVKLFRIDAWIGPASEARGEATARRGCAVRDFVRGTLDTLDAYEFVEGLGKRGRIVDAYYRWGDAVVAKHGRRLPPPTLATAAG